MLIPQLGTIMYAVRLTCLPPSSIYGHSIVVAVLCSSQYSNAILVVVLWTLLSHSGVAASEDGSKNMAGRFLHSQDNGTSAIEVGLSFFTRGRKLHFAIYTEVVYARERLIHIQISFCFSRADRIFL